MTDLSFSWKFYTYNLIFNTEFTGDIKGDAEQITLHPADRANPSVPIGTGVTLTYKFMGGKPDYIPSWNPDTTFMDHPISIENQETVREVFDEYSAVTQLVFVEVPADQEADISIFHVDTYLSSRGYSVPRDDKYEGNVWLGETLDAGLIDTLAYLKVFPDLQFKDLFRHELGHSLYLSHPANYHDPNYDLGYDPNSNAIPRHEESLQYSVMSYNPHGEFFDADTYETLFKEKYGVFGATTNDGLGLYDIKTLQYLYGANTAPTAGDDVYVFKAKDALIRTVYDSGGTDTFDLTNQLTGARVDIGEAHFSSIGLLHTEPEANILFKNNIAVAWDTLIENVIGSKHDDVIKGNEAANSLKGGAGNDVLIGGASSDVLVGGEGNDQIWAGKTDDAGDYINGGAGNDTVGGGTGDDTLKGEDGNDLLFLGTGSDMADAGRGDDILYGGKDEGADTLVGAGGHDTVFAGKGDDLLDGGDGADVLYSGGGDDTITAGSGADTLWGGSGDDLLVGGEGNDVFAFIPGSGLDVVKDFTVGEDKLDFQGFAFTDLKDIASAMVNGELDGVVLVLDASTSVFLEGVSLNDVTNDLVLSAG